MKNIILTFFKSTFSIVSQSSLEAQGIENVLSQIMINLRENANAVTFRSRKQVEETGKKSKISHG